MTFPAPLPLALPVLQLLLGGLCLATFKKNQDSAAVRLWSWGLVIGAAGMLLTLTIEPAVFRFAGGAAIAVAQMACFAGAIGYSRVRMRQRYLIAGLIACLAPVLLSVILPLKALQVDEVTPTPTAILLFLFTAWAVIWRGNGKVSRSARLVAVSLATAALAWLLRMAVVAIAPSEVADQTWAYFVLSQMVAVTAGTFGLLLIELRKREHVMDRFATADPVTGLPNRRAAMLRFKDEVARATRHDRTFAVVLLQVNRFPQIYKMRGSVVCDAVIGHVAETVRSAVRDEDVISRVTGETLVLLLPEQLVDGAVRMADRLCELVAATPCRYDAWPLNLTLSRGIAVYPIDGRDWETLYSVATRRILAADSTEVNPVRKRQSASSALGA